MQENDSTIERNNEADSRLWTPRFNDALSTVRRTSRDSRIVIFALLTFTLANFIVLLNGYERAWTKKRIAMVKQALIEDCLDDFTDGTPKIGPHAWESKYAKERDFMNCAELYRQYEALMRMYNEDILIIRVPIVGMRVDANWIAILSSIGLGLLLGALVKALSREKCALEFADHDEISRRARMENFFPQWIATIIIWLPILVAMLVYGYDFATIFKGRAIDNVLSFVTSILGGIGVLICILIAIKATRVLRSLVIVRRKGSEDM